MYIQLLSFAKFSQNKSPVLQDEVQLSPKSAKRCSIVKQVMSLKVSASINEPFMPSPASEPAISPKIPLVNESLFDNSEDKNDTSTLKKYQKSDLIAEWNSRDIENFPICWGMADTPDGLLFTYYGDIS